MNRFPWDIDKEPPHVLLNGEKVMIDSLEDKSVSRKQYTSIRADSDGWRAIIPKLDNECLKHVTRHYVSNSSRHPDSTYDFGLQEHIIPELLKRLGD